MIIIIYLHPLNKYLIKYYQIPYLDKVMHIINFLFLGIILHIKKINISYKIIFLLSSFGFVLEILQGLSPTSRTFDIKDFIADIVGILLIYPIIKMMKIINIKK
jgi:hypothetical protein